MGDWLRRAFHWLLARAGHVVTLSVVVGLAAGLGAVAFAWMLDQTNGLVLSKGAGYAMPRPGAEKFGRTPVPAPSVRRWVLVLAPAVGGLLAGILIYTFAPEAEGHGTDAVIDAFHRRRGYIRQRVPIIKTLASVLTVGTGGSAGREGPIGQIGAGFASALATFLRTSERDRRTLIIVGAGAGIGAIFRAPLGGALFAVEVLYRGPEFESAALVPAFIAAITAYSVYCGITGVWGPIFDVPALHFVHPRELAFYAMLGVACVPVAIVYVKVFYGIRDAFRRLRIPNQLKPAIGGLMVGGIAFFLPQILGMGYGWMQRAIDGELTLKIALLMLVFKLIATGLTIGSGGSGGVFAPSVVLGGLLGTVLGRAFHHVAPTIVPPPAAFVLVGMAAFFAGTAKVPVSSLVMLSEMTTGYGLLVPLMLANAISFMLTPRNVSIYEKQVNSRAESGAHADEFFFDVLGRIRVSESMAKDRIVTFSRGTSLADMLDAVSGGSQPIYPVLNSDGTLYGLIDGSAIRALLGMPPESSAIVVAEDLSTPGPRPLRADDSLATALRKLRGTMVDALPVVADTGAVIGLLSRRDISNAYHDAVYSKHAAEDAG